MVAGPADLSTGPRVLQDLFNPSDSGDGGCHLCAHTTWAPGLVFLAASLLPALTRRVALLGGPQANSKFEPEALSLTAHTEPNPADMQEACRSALPSRASGASAAPPTPWSL